MAEIEIMKVVETKVLLKAIRKVGNKIGINTNGKNDDGKGGACWQCALLDELNIE